MKGFSFGELIDRLGVTYTGLIVAVIVGVLWFVVSRKARNGGGGSREDNFDQD